MHQHFFSLEPQIFHIHMRGHGSSEQLARALLAAVRVTGTPLPQHPPRNPQTPLNASRLGEIIGGTPQIHERGVVSIAVGRRERVRLGGYHVRPMLNIMSHVGFEPLDDTGRVAAVAPDISMTAGEVQRVMRVMRRGGFQVNCLYNQETDEHPQLYFSHQLAIGDPETLARIARRGFDQTNLDFKSAS